VCGEREKNSKIKNIGEIELEIERGRESEREKERE